MREMVRHGALFNGIGGFQLAAHWMGWQNVWHCEIDKFCNQVVKQHFPESICYEDIKQFDAREWKGKIDIISGGDPCQPSSVIGDRRGKDDERYLWPEKKRIISEVLPSFVLNENVTGTISNGILDEKIADLESLGYTCWPPVIIPACAVGAAHKRNRVWLAAYLPERRLERRNYCNKEGYGQAAHRSVQALVENRDWTEFARTCVSGSVYGIPNRVDRIKALGNAIVPQVAYEIFTSLTWGEEKVKM